jgi:yeast amino acid transporter
MLPQNGLDDIELYARETNGSPSNIPVKRKVNFFVRFLDSFKRREGAISSLDDTSNPVEGDTSPLNRSLKGRHLQFIAIGGSIGAGLFIGCGKALAIGGPAWLLIAFSIVGMMLLCVMHALGELSAVYPISGINNSRFQS